MITVSEVYKSLDNLRQMIVIFLTQEIGKCDEFALNDGNVLFVKDGELKVWDNGTDSDVTVTPYDSFALSDGTTLLDLFNRYMDTLRDIE